ncbi:MAG: DUF4291 family protein [Bacteroidia bacterium]
MSKSPRILNCAFDEEGVYVYQAFSPHIVANAVELGTFGKGFGLDRTSWIKPSFGWTLQRSEYATKHRMEAIARIKVHHWAWFEMLQSSAPAHYDPNIYANELEWNAALKRCQVVMQWDPDRNLDGRPNGRPAIQLGLKAEILPRYVNEFIIGVEDVTELARRCGEIARARRTDFPEVPLEREYAIEDAELARRVLG